MPGRTGGTRARPTAEVELRATGKSVFDPRRTLAGERYAARRNVSRKEKDAGRPTRKHLSYWIDTTPRTNYPVMEKDSAVDVAVLGGGITSLTAAALLKKLGKTVAVVELKL